MKPISLHFDHFSKWNLRYFLDNYQKTAKNRFKLIPKMDFNPGNQILLKFWISKTFFQFKIDLELPNLWPIFQCHRWEVYDLSLWNKSGTETERIAISAKPFTNPKFYGQNHSGFKIHFWTRFQSTFWQNEGQFSITGIVNNEVPERNKTERNIRNPVKVIYKSLNYIF